MKKKLAACLTAVMLCVVAAMPAAAASPTVVTGATVQKGSGDPSLSNVREISGVGTYNPSDGKWYYDYKFEEDGISYSYAIPMDYPLFDGDSMQITTNHGTITVSGTRTRKMVQFKGTEGWFHSGSTTNPRLCLAVAGYGWSVPTSMQVMADVKCTHLPSRTGMDVYNSIDGVTLGVTGSTQYLLLYVSGYMDVADWKAYLSAQYAAGTPFTVVAALETPVTWTHTGNYYASAGREDLQGTEGVVEDAVGLLDTVYEYLPELRPGVVAFMTAARYTFPAWFSMAFLLSLILIVFKVFLRFMWR